MFQDCMKDLMITLRKVCSSEKSKSNAILEIAKGLDLYHSEKVFKTFYTALKKRQLLVYSDMFQVYVKMYERGELDSYKETDNAIYTSTTNEHLKFIGEGE